MASAHSGSGAYGHGANTHGIFKQLSHTRMHKHYSDVQKQVQYMNPEMCVIAPASPATQHPQVKPNICKEAYMLTPCAIVKSIWNTQT